MTAEGRSGPDGLLVLDKPAGWTSHDAVARVRRLLGTRKVGHAGTLDPMATGVLVIGVGRATRLLTYLVAADKTYRATIRLGIETVTDDAEGAVSGSVDASGLGPAAVVAGIRDLTGPLSQIPSAVSAIKVDGQRAYARVRAGEQVELAARSVVVRRFEALAFRTPETPGSPVLDVDVEVEVTSGTYVRALARDLGQALGVGGHLISLRRTRVGPYGLDQARSLDDLAGDPQTQPMADAARAAFPSRDLDPGEVVALRHGRRITATGRAEKPVAGIGPDGSLVALLEDLGTTARSLLVIAD
jgi:tRNA pseudouridine55 synthase